MPTPAPTLTPPALDVPMLTEPNGPMGTLMPTPMLEQAVSARASAPRQASTMLRRGMKEAKQR
jgi:hypothetical protein